MDIPLGIIKGVGVKGYGVMLIWDLNMAKYKPIVTGIRQIYADSDRHWTNIHR